ncbi:MAG: S-methyl-5-thioribose-1-phosphate isomerase [Desulfonauticus sp.]|nr:S-methyl-5-thioribose-1-phosphate isomerase [Desulfonauticus sp.]
MKHIVFDADRSVLKLLDQRLLPEQEKWFECHKLEDVIFALQQMVIRGAPAIGITAAYGCCILLKEVQCHRDWKSKLEQGLKILSQARPTAVNLSWAVKKMQDRMKDVEVSPKELYEIWAKDALEIHRQDIEMNKKMGRLGADLLDDKDVVMTHCNAGALATGGYGTALGVIRAAIEQGKQITVIANETRPFLQGARLTAYELQKDDIPVKVACDNACAFLMKNQLVNKVIVGADRIVANGDVANKIGTYGVAILAREHNIPFYVAAPFSTIDIGLSKGEDIPIEERCPQEVTHIENKQITPQGVEVFNYAFDITPANLISAIITEKKVFYFPYDFKINS